jgi:asparagine synthase (glutamine-hydrolysing)
MCGIIGLINKNKEEVDYSVMEQMAESLSHRGPDEEGWFIEGPLGLYHKRLSIIDLVSGRQPMSTDGVTVVFNGEIYNYLEEKNFLKQSGHIFQTTSDTEVILRLYIHYGTDFIEHLNGMFAFVLYDRNKQIVITARDHFGIKPLYYYVDSHHILFSSEIKALLRHPQVKAEPDYESIKDYLTFQFVLEEGTLFKNIQKVLPGCYQIVDLGSMDIKTFRFWEPTFKVDTHHTEEYFIHELGRLLNDAVSIQLRSDVPVGTYLSGGMDSSIVTLLAADKYPGCLKSFTGAFREGPEFNETEYAREVATACGAEIQEIYPSESDFIRLLPHLIYHMDEPVAGPGLFPQYMVSRLASQKVKVVLGGQGGDEIFGGYARYVVAYLEQALKGAINETNDEGEHIVSLKSILPNLPYLRQYIPMMRRFWQKEAFEPMDRRYFSLIDRCNCDLGLFTEDFFDPGGYEDRFDRFQATFNHPDTLSYYNKMIHFDLVTSLPALLHVEDRVTMANSLESRVPLLDHRITDLITTMPPSMKFKGAEMKYILKKTVKDLLPMKIMKRKDKMGFPVPLHIWAKNNAKGFFCDVLLSRSCRERGLFNMAEVENLIEEENAFGRRLWGMLNLELWFQTFIDG